MNVRQLQILEQQEKILKILQKKPLKQQLVGFALPGSIGLAQRTVVNQALAEMKGDGTLDTLTTTWLSKKTNVGEVPVFTP